MKLAVTMLYYFIGYMGVRAMRKHEIKYTSNCEQNKKNLFYVCDTWCNAIL